MHGYTLYSRIQGIEPETRPPPLSASPFAMALVDQVAALEEKGVVFSDGFHNLLAEAEGGCPHATARCITEMGQVEGEKRALANLNTGLRNFFVKESSLNKQEMLPDIDHMDVGARQETLAVRGEPVMYQMCLVPAYALTIHKTQALSIKHLVIGCLEGVFAMGRQTDQNCVSL